MTALKKLLVKGNPYLIAIVPYDFDFLHDLAIFYIITCCTSLIFFGVFWSLLEYSSALLYCDNSKYSDFSDSEFPCLSKT